MENLMERADELRRKGLTEHRVFRALSREFPHAERDVVVRASRIPGAPTGYLPSWAQRVGLDKNKNSTVEPNGAVLRPVIARRPPGGVK